MDNFDGCNELGSYISQTNTSKFKQFVLENIQNITSWSINYPGSEPLQLYTIWRMRFVIRLRDYKKKEPSCEIGHHQYDKDIWLLICKGLNPTIMHDPAVDNLLKSHSNVKDYVYAVCIQGLKLFSDDAVECNYCQSQRFNVAESQLQVPAASIKIISIGDVIAQLVFI